MSKKDPQALVKQAALQLFSEQGYFNTSVPDLVKASGVSTGSIYHHFGDKEGVARALFDSVVERMQVAIEEIQQKHLSVPEQCKAIIELLFVITENEPDLMRYMLHAKHAEFLSDVAPICSSSPFKKMRSIVSMGMKTKEVHEMDETVAAAAVFGGAIRLVQMRLDGVIEKNLLSYVDEVWFCAWRSVAI